MVPTWRVHQRACWSSRCGCAPSLLPVSPPAHARPRPPAPAPFFAAARPQEKLKKHAVQSGGKPVFMMSVWKNGIVLGEPKWDTKPIPLDTPDGVQILADLEAGRMDNRTRLFSLLPPDVQQLALKGSIEISFTDHRGEPEGTFKPPPPGPYDGVAGNSLGGGGGAPAAGAVVQDSAGMAPPVLPAGAPSTAIQIKLANGQKLVVKLAPTHTVGDLQRVAAGAHATGGKAFVLKAGFPPKDLTDPSATIQAAGLSGAAVTQAVL